MVKIREGKCELGGLHPLSRDTYSVSSFIFITTARGCFLSCLLPFSYGGSFSSLVAGDGEVFIILQ